MRKGLNIVFTTIEVLLIFGAFIYFFDDNYFNDATGWTFLLIFWLVRTVHQMLLDYMDGNKNRARFQLVFACVILGLVVWKRFG
ncbi:hypothetical protein LCM10_16465 [Rossellomorea aquimaris]|uniref:hypothetical protein n=1 Tax=Rossellomorea aquimaris TaxID=189382 RepID=UPI001CD28C7B|nr:hypothetical protein [Rossellomorea aquimaris]MCA1056595.1 hypothetical protein [Rossellomorea aquimaris]